MSGTVLDYTMPAREGRAFAAGRKLFVAALLAWCAIHVASTAYVAVRYNGAKAWPLDLSWDYAARQGQCTAYLALATTVVLAGTRAKPRWRRLAVLVCVVAALAAAATEVATAARFKPPPFAAVWNGDDDASDKLREHGQLLLSRALVPLAACVALARTAWCTWRFAAAVAAVTFAACAFIEGLAFWPPWRPNALSNRAFVWGFAFETQAASVGLCVLGFALTAASLLWSAMRGGEPRLARWAAWVGIAGTLGFAVASGQVIARMIPSLSVDRVVAMVAFGARYALCALAALPMALWPADAVEARSSAQTP